jgi:hypothetical protein
MVMDHDSLGAFGQLAIISDLRVCAALSSAAGAIWGTIRKANAKTEIRKPWVMMAGINMAIVILLIWWCQFCYSRSDVCGWCEILKPFGQGVRWEIDCFLENHMHKQKQRFCLHHQADHLFIF